MIVRKVSFEISQLVAAECFLGFHKRVWNPRINFFLLGRRQNHDIFDLYQTRLNLRVIIYVLIDLFTKYSQLWFIADKFVEFNEVKELIQLKSRLFRLVTFHINTWPKGLLSNYKHAVSFKIDSFRFPHIIFTADSVENFAAINEAFSIKIPSIALTDTNSSPIHSFFSIPANTKSFKSLFLFCIFIAKAASYSRGIRAGKFLFSAFKKSNKLRKIFRTKQFSSFKFESTNIKLSYFDKKFYDLLIPTFLQLLSRQDSSYLRSYRRTFITVSNKLSDSFSGLMLLELEFFFRLFFSTPFKRYSVRFPNLFNNLLNNINKI